MPHNPRKNVLWWKQGPATDADRQVLTAALGKLKAARDRRTTPFVDTTAYVNWNAMLASALLQAAALLDAYETTGESPWLDRAVAVMRWCTMAHWDDAAGGFFDLARDRGGAAYLATRAKPVQDSPTPSPNGVAALVLARLWALTDTKEWRAQLDRQLETFAGNVAELSLYGATLLRAIDWAVHPVTRIEVSGPRGDGPACAMHVLALQTYRPRKVVVRKIADDHLAGAVGLEREHVHGARRAVAPGPRNLDARDGMHRPVDGPQQRGAVKRQLGDVSGERLELAVQLGAPFLRIGERPEPGEHQRRDAVG